MDRETKHAKSIIVDDLKKFILIPILRENIAAEAVVTRTKPVSTRSWLTTSRATMSPGTVRANTFAVRPPKCTLTPSKAYTASSSAA